MLRSGAGAGVMAALMVVALSSCGNPPPKPSTPSTAAPSRSPRPSAAAGPCATVTTTTAIADVPAACAALWAPYGVTKVPPANLTDSTPPAPATLTNDTDGRLPDPQLAALVTASNRASLWYRWAEANDQSALMSHLGLVRLDPAAELQAMASNEPISQPDCALFPIRLTVFAITADDRQFFSAQPETAQDPYVFVGTYPGPCTVTATTPAGKTVTLASYASAGVTFFVSHLINDPLLGAVLFFDGAGNCTQSGAPTRWCQS